MKYGRRHMKLKEQTYVRIQDADGYKRPHKPIPVEEPTGQFVLGEAEPLALTDLIDKRSRNALKRAEQVSRARYDEF
ncbi:MAG TPA: hypothetical protein VNZ52_13575 [Candidatus Thermoplasmatota archaeon]|nr:hypothetical protein [Candidatus Thermoplasmatota archaeon]